MKYLIILLVTASLSACFEKPFNFNVGDCFTDRYSERWEREIYKVQEVGINKILYLRWVGKDEKTIINVDGWAEQFDMYWKPAVLNKTELLTDYKKIKCPEGESNEFN